MEDESARESGVTYENSHRERDTELRPKGHEGRTEEQRGRQ